MASDPIVAIQASLPPATDYLTYLTILESHLSPRILPALNNILQDAVLTQNIGWDLIQLLTPLPGAGACLATIARLGNPREVVLKVTEALRLLNAEEEEEEEEGDDDEVNDDKDKDEDDVNVYENESKDQDQDQNNIPASDGDAAAPPLAPTRIDRFCTLVSLLATVHPRIRTRYPSRFLSTSLIAVLSAYRPTDEATAAVISFLHALSGNKRPPLPQRTSSRSATTAPPPPRALDHPNASAPDPEATAEDPQEAAIQTKLLQSFVTHILEEYVAANRLEWTARVQEHLDPAKVVPGRRTCKDAFKEDPILVDRDVMVGKLVAVARDLGLSGCEILFDAIYAEPRAAGDEDLDAEHPSSPDDVPLSQLGSLYLVSYFIFASVLFDAHVPLPPLSLFPGHARLTQRFIGTGGPHRIGGEATAVIDSILTMGWWLEGANRFVSGPLADADFLGYLQTLALVSANTPDAPLRAGAHTLLARILHAHPVDRTRLAFIVDTLENCPFEALRASAVGWLKDELVTAHERGSDNLFASTVAVAAAQPYLFPDPSSALAPPAVVVSDAEAWDAFRPAFPFHMAVLNFLYFLRATPYAAMVVPPATLTVAEEMYVGPLRVVQARLRAALLLPGGSLGAHLRSAGGDDDDDDAAVAAALAEVELLGQRIDMSGEGESAGVA